MNDITESGNQEGSKISAELRRIQVAKLMAKGISKVSEIAVALGLDPEKRTVIDKLYNDIRKVLDEWKARTTQDLESLQAKVFVRLDYIYQEQMAEYDRSVRERQEALDAIDMDAPPEESAKQRKAVPEINHSLLSDAKSTLAEIGKITGKAKELNSRSARDANQAQETKDFWNKIQKRADEINAALTPKKVEATVEPTPLLPAPKDNP